MKKVLVVIVVLAGLGFVVFKLNVTNKISVARPLPGPAPALYRNIADQRHWHNWSAGSFTVTKQLFNSVEVRSSEGWKGIFLIIPKNKDSTTVHWQLASPQHDKVFFTANKLEKRMEAVLDSLSAFMADMKNVYGMHITESTTTDTNLVATRFVDSVYPSTENIYAHIGKLKNFAASKNARQVSPPMLNVTQEFDGTYKCMVALPVNKKIENADSGTVFFTRMVPAKFYMAEIKGGPSTIKHAHEMMQQFFSDYQLTVMALPFEYLVTDRLVEKDTAKWISRIYTPFFY